MTETVTWSELKAFGVRTGLTARMRWVLTSGGRYVVWLDGTGMTILTKFLAADADGLDFAANVLPILQADRVTHDNLLAVRSLKYDPNRRPFQYGYQFNVTDPSGPNILDVLVAPDMVGADGYTQLIGGRFWPPEDAAVTDTIDALVVDKDGTIPDFIDGLHPSLMAHLGLPTDGSSAFEASEKFVKDRNLDVGFPHGSGLEPGGNEPVLAGLYVRVIYNATKGTAYTSPARCNLHFSR
jgi:hypothetical protein